MARRDVTADEVINIFDLAFLGSRYGQNHPLADINADGTADVIWRHTTGVVAVWLMDSTTITGVTFPGAAALDLVIQAVGDVDGNGTASSTVMLRVDENDLLDAALAADSSGFIKPTAAEYAGGNMPLAMAAADEGVLNLLVAGAALGTTFNIKGFVTYLQD